VKGNDATDVETLAALSLDPEIRKLGQGRSATRLLWEACQIPDFRKLATDQHSKLCARVFTHLRRDHVLPPAWIGAEFELLDKTEGDIDTLMQRLADVRVWAYITARGDWMRDAAPWQNRAREIEDKISDTLHEKLMARFVDRRAAHLTRRLEALETPGAEELLSAVSARGVVLVEGHEVGHIEGFNFFPDPAAQGPEKKFLLRAARRALGSEMPRRILRAELAADGAFSIAGQHILWEGAQIARLRKGATMLRPAVEMLGSEFLDGAARERLRLRLAAYLAAEIGNGLAPLFQVMAAPKPEFRGLIHRLGEAIGVLPGAETPPSLRAALKPLGIEAGQFAVFLPALLKPKAAGMRALLWGLWHSMEPPVLPAAGLVCAPGWEDEATALAMGWVTAGPVMLRLDIAEKMARELNYLIRKHPVPLPAGLGSRMSLKPEQLPAVLNRLGFRIIPSATLAEQKYGPPAPPMLARRKAVKPVAVKPLPEVAAPLPDNPFAALAALRRAAS
jgi:ATP-dependent RNA helicase SUPV3L1/SUV3